MAELLIVGAATDGPIYEVTKSTDIKSTVGLYGGNYIQRDSITSSATSIVLDYFPWGNQIANVVDGIKSQLYSPTVSPTGNIYTFGSTGAVSGNVLDLYYTPFLGYPDLITAAKNYSQTTGKTPYVCRIGGSYATLAVSGWAILSKYPGAKYNNLSVTITPTSLTLTGLEPNFSTLTYIGSTPYDIYIQSQNDYSYGISPIKITAYPGTGVNIGTTQLVNGSDGVLGDGSVSDTDIATFFDSFELPNEITHVLVLTPTTTGLINGIFNLYNDSDAQVRMFVAPTPTWSGTTSGFSTLIGQAIPERLNLLGVVLGTGNSLINNVFSNRYVAENAVISLVNSVNYNFTNLKLNQVDFAPELNQTDLDNLLSLGVMAPTRYIGNDISVYRGIMSNGVDTPPLVNIYSEIYSRSYPILFGYYGSILNNGPQPTIEKNLVASLQSIPFLTNVACTSQYSLGELDITVSGIFYDEVLSISFNINNG